MSKAHHAQLLPWIEVAIDLIGPSHIEVNGQKIEFNALTCIHPVTNLVEIICIDNKTAAHVAQLFENCWVSRYPRPNSCIHDNGGEFIGEEFQHKLQQHGITKLLQHPVILKQMLYVNVCTKLLQMYYELL